LVGDMPTGSRIALLSTDHQHRHIFFHAQHEPEVTALFERLVNRSAVVFDVGANVGYFSLLARDLGASVHSFEPNPFVRALLERSARLDDERLTILPYAVSDTLGTVPLYLSDLRNTGMTSLVRQSAESVIVPLVTLDEYVTSSGVIPELVKIDVEGHEGAVLRGAEMLLCEYRPTLVVETTQKATVDWLSERGYMPQTIRSDGKLDPFARLAGDDWENLCFTKLA